MDFAIVHNRVAAVFAENFDCELSPFEQEIVTAPLVGFQGQQRRLAYDGISNINRTITYDFGTAVCHDISPGEDSATTYSIFYKLPTHKNLAILITGVVELPSFVDDNCDAELHDLEVHAYEGPDAEKWLDFKHDKLVSDQLHEIATDTVQRLVNTILSYKILPSKTEACKMVSKCAKTYAMGDRPPPASSSAVTADGPNVTTVAAIPPSVFRFVR